MMVVLFTPASCEAVAAERAARMGATLRRGSKTAQKRPKDSGVKRPACPTVALAKVEGRALAPRASLGLCPGERRRAKFKGNVCKGSSFLAHPGKEEPRGGSRRGLPLRAAARSGAGGRTAGCALGLSPKHINPAGLRKTREGYRGRRETPPIPYRTRRKHLYTVNQRRKHWVFWVCGYLMRGFAARQAAPRPAPRGASRPAGESPSLFPAPLLPLPQLKQARLQTIL